MGWMDGLRARGGANGDFVKSSNGLDVSFQTPILKSEILRKDKGDQCLISHRPRLV